MAGAGLSELTFRTCVQHQSRVAGAVEAALCGAGACIMVQRVVPYGTAGVAWLAGKTIGISYYPPVPPPLNQAPTPSRACCERPGVHRMLYKVQRAAVTASRELSRQTVRQSNRCDRLQYALTMMRQLLERVLYMVWPEVQRGVARFVSAPA